MKLNLQSTWTNLTMHEWTLHEDTLTKETAHCCANIEFLLLAQAIAIHLRLGLRFSSRTGWPYSDMGLKGSFTSPSLNGLLGAAINHQ